MAATGRGRRTIRRWSSRHQGLASTVIHRLADRGLIDYDVPVGEYWPEFAANGKADITVREVMRHHAGLSQLSGVRKAELLDHVVMEERIATAHRTGCWANRPITR